MKGISVVHHYRPRIEANEGYVCHSVTEQGGGGGGVGVTWSQGGGEWTSPQSPPSPGQDHHPPGRKGH